MTYLSNPLTFGALDPEPKGTGSLDLIFVDVHARHARIRAAADRFLILSAVQIF
jgi:hypothetical protein